MKVQILTIFAAIILLNVVLAAPQAPLPLPPGGIKEGQVPIAFAGGALVDVKKILQIVLAELGKLKAAPAP